MTTKAARRRAMPDDPIPGTPFTVEHFCAWASELELDDGEPWVPDDFFLAFLQDVFAGYPECWLLVPEGSGKTTDIAGLALYHCEHRQDAWVPWAAASREQATIGFRQAAGFVRRSDQRLALDFDCLEGYRRIRHNRNGSRIEVFAADSNTGDGVIPTMAVIDELHRHKNMSLYRTWSGKLAKRKGQLIVISTAGEPGSDFESTRTKIRTGGIDIDASPGFQRSAGKRVVMHDWSIADDDDPSDLDAVLRANPSPRVTREVLDDKFNSPTMSPQHWARFVCNRPTRSSMAAITEGEWANAYNEDEIPDRALVWVGIDVGWKWDTTAMVPCYERPGPRGPEYLLGTPVILVPPRDGSSLGNGEFEAGFKKLIKRYEIHTVVMDTTRAEPQAEWIRTEFDIDVVDRAQSTSLAVMDYERFMAGLREHTLWHNGDRGMTEHAMNAVAKMLPEGKMRFVRPVSSRHDLENQDRRVIDALVAAAMVHSQLVAGSEVIVKAPARVINLAALDLDD